LLLLCLLSSMEAAPAAGEEDGAGLHLGINALAFVDSAGQTVKRRLEVSWWGAEVQEGDRIIIDSPHTAATTTIYPAEHPDGFIVLAGNLPYPDMTEMGFSRNCVLEAAASWEREDGAEVAVTCLQSEPTWQWDHKEELAHLPVRQLMLAGAHDAGAYRDYQGIGDDNWATSAVFAQEEDLLHQLLWGVRFLDIRAGFYPFSDQRFWLVHGVIRTHPMAEGIQDVIEFLRNTRELVVWEINGFEQVWDTAAHEEFKALLVSSFSDWLVVPGAAGWDAPLGDVWDRPGLAQDQGRLIITYNANAHTDPELFFPEVQERWGDQDEPEELHKYLIEEVAKATDNPAYQPWKPNCQMTPNAEDIVGGRWSGLREMADAVNRNVTRWWRADWPDLPATFPISDFVVSTGMVRESIERNLRLAARTRTV